MTEATEQLSDRPARPLRRQRGARLLIGGALLLGAVAGAAYYWTRPTASALLAEARVAFEAEDYPAALHAAEAALRREPASIDALLIAGGSAAQQGNYAGAVALYDRLPHTENPRADDGRAIAAHLVFFKLHRVSEAEQRLRAILARNARHPLAVTGLADLLGFTGRRHEAIPYLLELIRQQRISVNQLTLLGSESGAHREPDLLERCREQTPGDPLPLLGLAWQAEHDGRLPQAEQLARQAAANGPQLLEAHVAVARLLSRQGRVQELIAWLPMLPAGADDHPEVWQLRGDCALGLNEVAAAAHCYWESVRRNPNSRAALHGLQQALRSLGETERAVPFESRARELQKLEESESFLFESQHRTLTPIRQVAEQMEVLGRHWESSAWSQVAMQINPQERWPQERTLRLRAGLGDGTPQTLASSNPALQIDLSDLPLPKFSAPAAATPDATVAASVSTLVQFQNIAEDIGLVVQYHNGGDPRTPGQQMYEFSGGGVGVLDYDLDGWPDLYLTQGSDWPPDPGQRTHLDRLFRNRAGRSAIDVTSQAEVAESGYSQGVAVGDFDADGFPDVYVANIGANRLYRNNGDGTLSDASSAVSDDQRLWTTSCLMADLSGDGLPDLYDANYLAEDDVFERMCQHKDGVPRMCAPFDFSAAPDQFYENAGDGTFRDMTRESGFDVPNGKGLGLAAADFDGTGRLSLFVANDLVPNFYFRNDTPAGGPPAFTEIGFASGTAVDHAGQSQGCMGIAVGDLNADGALDLFITNFAQEYNAYYQQVAPSSFRDVIRNSGVAEATLPVLGFGTQPVDADLDGDLDLLVTNGQVDDHRAYGREYQMRPQYFHNDGNGRFADLPAATVGEFFAGKYLGRGMARLDWNRDALDDIAISHLDSPAALLANRTTEAGHFLTVRLVGTHSSREAIGATVVVDTAAGRSMRQLTAGDGYQASNERLLVVGLGRHPIDRLHVRWPSGVEQTFEGLGTDRRLTLIEGRALLYPAIGDSTPSRP